MRFCMPYESFISLSNDINNHNIFNRWLCTDNCGEPPSNINLLLLGFLRYIGRVWTLGDIEEVNGISREVNRIFLCCFMEYGSTILYNKWDIDAHVNTPISDMERLLCMAGFNGYIGSSGATHIGMLCCAAWAHMMHKGYKLNIPSHTYNMTTNHSQKNLGLTMGHPATWNDKNIVLFDPLSCNVKDGVIPDNFEFMLFERNLEGNIIEVPYIGVWFR